MSKLVESWQKSLLRYEQKLTKKFRTVDLIFMIILLVELHLFFTSEKCPESQIKQKYICLQYFWKLRYLHRYFKISFWTLLRNDLSVREQTFSSLIWQQSHLTLCFVYVKANTLKILKISIKLFQAVCYKEGIFHACVLIYHYDKRVIKPGSPFIWMLSTILQ